jgi:hypothetical protein
MQYRNSRNWKPIPYTAEERAENEQWKREQAEEAAAAYDEAQRIRAELHPAFAATAALLVKQASEDIGLHLGDIAVTNEECIVFVLEQVTKIGKRASGAAKDELRSIYRDIKVRGGDAYAEHKARLQQLAKEVR